jgi:ribonuclease HII
MLVVAGVDEVGRGAMAGPLLSAAVVFPACRGATLRKLRMALADVRDSKLLPPGRRTQLDRAIREQAISVGIGIVDVEELDGVGVGPANRMAMERAVLALDTAVDALIIDACVLDLGCPQTGPIDGDALSLSVAAASIVAKVTRDQMMIDLAAVDSRYGFELHKGYCSGLHRERLSLHGPSAHHRRCFAPVSAALAAT